MSVGDFDILALDHVQLAMPAGGEARATAFYVGALGLSEEPKPANLAARGGCWFAGGSLRLHLGVEADFRPARKAHPAIRVRGIGALRARLEAGGWSVSDEEPLAGHERLYVDDPFGNRIEVLEPISREAGASTSAT